MTDLQAMMSARRADLEGGPPVANGGPGVEVEVIAPGDTQGTPQPEAGTAPAPAGPGAEIVPRNDEAAPPAFPMIPPKVLGGLPYAANYMKLAKTIHNTELVPKAFQGRPDAIMAAMMYGYELGLGPMQALNGLHVIDGKVGQDAELMRALITEAGHLFVLQVGESDQGEPWATVYCRRKDWPADIPTAEFIYTMQDGREAGLVEWFEKWTRTETGKNRKLTWNPHGREARPDWVDRGAELKVASSWQNFGQDMVIARVTARAARANFADVLKGMSYTPEELRQFEGASQETMEVPPSPPAPPTPSPADGPSADQSTDEPPSSDAPTSASPTPDETPLAEEKPKRTRSSAKKTAAKTETPPASSSPGGSDDSSSTSPPSSSEPAPPAVPAESSSSPSAEPVQPDLEGNEPAPPTPAPEPGEGAVVGQLVKSLRDLLRSKPEADRTIIQAFLGRHWPGKKADELDADQLTKAINIVGGWPGSADKYPAPEPEALDDF